MSKIRKSSYIFAYMIIVSAVAFNFMPDDQINVWSGEISDYGWGGVIFELLKLPLLCLSAIIYMAIVEFTVKKVTKNPNYILPQIFDYVWIAGLIFIAIKHSLMILNQLGSGLPIDIIAPIVTGIFIILIGNNIAKGLIPSICNTINTKEQRLQQLMYRSFRFLGYLFVFYGLSLVSSPLFNQQKIIFDKVSSIGMIISISIWLLYTIYIWITTKKHF
jgi:xanthine/uracil permease